MLFAERSYAPSHQHSPSVQSEDAESVASQLQPVRSAELNSQATVPSLTNLKGGGLLPLPKEPSKASVASGCVARDVLFKMIFCPGML